MSSSVVQLPRQKYYDKKNNPRVTRKYKEVSRRVRKCQTACGIINKGSRSIMKHKKVSRSLSLGSCTTLLDMDCLVYIAAAVALALASKPSLEVDNVF